MFEDRAKNFAERAEGGAKVFNEQDFLYDLQNEADLFRKNKDKIGHLRNIELEIKKIKDDHEKICPHDPGSCHKSKTLAKCLFFVDQELNEIVDENLDETYFSGKESVFDDNDITILHTKIDSVLERLDKLGYGQEIIYDEIEELKESSKKISKKDFKLLLLGKLVAFGERRLLGEQSVQELFTSAGEVFEKMITE